MFVQVIQGRASDAQGLRKQFERWNEEIKPGAAGFLGSTGGVTEDGELFIAARFESEDAARKNSERPEQGKWWEETSQYIDGEATFIEYTQVQQMKDGGSNDAGFVQAMQGRTSDINKAKQMDEEFADVSRDVRPDLIGGITAWKEDGTFTSVNYFTSEAEARKAETQEPPPEVQKQMQDWMSLFSDMKYIDLKEPWFSSP